MIREGQSTDELLDELSRQKALLECQNELSPDGILVVDHERRWLTCNQRFLDMWRVDQQPVQERRSSPDFVRSLSRFVKHPEQFARRTEECYAHPERESWEEIEMLDGRIIERYSVPFKPHEDALPGRAWYFRDITGRKRVEQELRESENKFRTIFDAEPECVKVLDAEGRLLEMNRAGLEMIGAASVAPLLGQCVLSLVAAEHRAAFEALLGRTIAGENGRLAFEMVGLTGTRRWMETQAAPLRNAADEITSALFVTRDVTAQRLAEQSLRDNEERLQRIVHGMPVMMDAFDERGTLVAWNAECERITGYSAAEMIGNPRAMELLYPDAAYLASMMQHWKARGNDYVNWEWELTCKDGTVRTIAWSNSSAKIPIAGWASWGVGVDVTERRRTEQALRDSQGLLERAQSVGQIGSWISDPERDGRLKWSAEACRIFGLDEATFDGHVETFFKLVHPDDLPSVVEASRAALAAERPYAVMHRIVRPDGTLRWVIQQADVERDSSGKPTRMVGVVRDITDSKRAEEKLAQQQAELLHASRLSTMGQMVATMSHEISQPLAALGNFSTACAKMLEATPAADPELFRSYVGEIARQSQRAGAIIRRLRAFGSRATPQRELCDLNWLLHDSADLVASELRRCGVSIQLELPAPPLAAAVDRIQLQQVMVNLLTNACEAACDVEVARRSVLIRCYGADGHAVIEVVDQGAGLSPAAMDSLYQPFFTTKPDGMGLGLTICRQIMEDHGGTIEGHNGHGCGAIFRLRLPLEEAECAPGEVSG